MSTEASAYLKQSTGERQVLSTIYLSSQKQIHTSTLLCTELNFDAITPNQPIPRGSLGFILWQEAVNMTLFNITL